MYKIQNKASIVLLIKKCEWKFNNVFAGMDREKKFSSKKSSTFLKMSVNKMNQRYSRQETFLEMFET